MQMEVFMKKLLVLLSVGVLALGIVGCNKPDQIVVIHVRSDSEGHLQHIRRHREIGPVILTHRIRRTTEKVIHLAA